MAVRRRTSMGSRRWALTFSGSLLGAALALTVTAAGAVEDFESANYALPGCPGVVQMKDAVKNGLEAQLIGYCSGILKALITLGQARVFNDRLGCVSIPQGVTIQQAARIVVSGIEARPQMMHENFVVLAFAALNDAWPCRK
jgi:hypothetical protein